MNRQYCCKNDGRRQAVKETVDSSGNPILNGIDYLEVVSEDQLTMEVHFLHDLPDQAAPVPAGPELKKENIRIEGGVRIKNINIKKVSSNNNILTVIVDEAGDFSIYTLRLATSAIGSEPPQGFDPQLSAVEFSFKAGCPSDFDCKREQVCPTEKISEPEINYLAKDYASFRRLMLDRMSIIMPDWKERSPADLQVALVELLAYSGDRLSYYQDAAATEAYLGTARRRVSLRRHVRLLDYVVSEGCNSRTWVYIEVEKNGGADGEDLPAGTKLFTGSGSGKRTVTPEKLQQVLAEQPVVFETMHDIKLHFAHNTIRFYTWSDSECCLPRGSTRATLVDKPVLSLKAEDVLVFEEVLSPTTGTAADADPAHRHPVRLKKVVPGKDPLTDTPVLEIEWHEEDALPFPLCLTAKARSGGGTEEISEISVARGNIVLADFGLTIGSGKLIPDTAPKIGHFRPRLKHKDITIAVPYDHVSMRLKGASSALVQRPENALPCVYLKDSETWQARGDLLGSDRFAPEFVVEVERDRTAFLRFGDDVFGKKPAAGFKPAVIYRIGSGRKGNIGADALTRVEWEAGGIEEVRNPLPAAGGRSAETMVEVRCFAPQAFKKQKRAVTEADYSEKTERHRDVQRAAARFRWTGSWYTVFITIDRKGGREVDTDFEEEIRGHLEQYRMAGYDLEINGPVFVPLDIKIRVCVKPGYFKGHVKESLCKTFSRHDQADGSRGFFHPDNFTFGQPVYLGAIFRRAMGIAGVASMEVDVFQRWGKTAKNEIEDGYLKPAELEIIRLDNDPNFPENGRIDFTLMGGL